MMGNSRRFRPQDDWVHPIGTSRLRARWARIKRWLGIV